MGRPFTGTDIERFWLKTRLNGACVEFTGWRDKDGYGRHGVRRDDGTYLTVVAHRWIFERAHGKLPAGMVVMHSCDNPACVALDHLSAGTQRDNQQDSVAKGRHISKPGELHPRAKLTWDQVREIRASAEDGVTLGKRYGVSKYAIWCVRHNKTWRVSP